MNPQAFIDIGDHTHYVNIDDGTTVRTADFDFGALDPKNSPNCALSCPGAGSLNYAVSLRRNSMSSSLRKITRERERRARRERKPQRRLGKRANASDKPIAT